MKSDANIFSESVLVKVPELAWDTLEETLILDTQSYSFSPSLRELIKEALKSVRVVERQKVRRAWHLSLLIPEGAWDVMEETLGMDMTSKWSGSDVKKLLRKAWDRLEVKKISPKDWSPLWDTR